MENNWLPTLFSNTAMQKVIVDERDLILARWVEALGRGAALHHFSALLRWCRPCHVCRRVQCIAAAGGIARARGAAHVTIGVPLPYELSPQSHPYLRAGGYGKRDRRRARSQWWAWWAPDTSGCVRRLILLVSAHMSWVAAVCWW